MLPTEPDKGATRRANFSRCPYEGRPKKIPMQGLLSFDLEAYLKLFGLSLPQIFKDEGLGNAWRAIERLKKKGDTSKRPSKALNAFLSKVAEKYVAPDGFDLINDAATGCEHSLLQVERLTQSEALLLGSGFRHDAWCRRHRHLVLMERVGIQAQIMLIQGDRAGAVELIASHPISQALLWPGVLEALQQGEDLQSLAPVTMAMALDANLGWLAAWDIDDAEKFGLPRPILSRVLPSTSRPGRNPTSLLFEEFKSRIGMPSAAKILEKSSVPVDASTIYRWSSGKQLPDEGTLAALMRAHGLSHSHEQEPIYRQLGAAKLVNLIGYLAQRLSKKGKELGSSAAAWPWPAYPFGHADFESWAARRYPFWLDFHRQKEKTLAELTKAPTLST